MIIRLRTKFLRKIKLKHITQFKNYTQESEDLKRRMENIKKIEIMLGRTNKQNYYFQDVEPIMSSPSSILFYLITGASIFSYCYYKCKFFFLKKRFI